MRRNAVRSRYAGGLSEAELGQAAKFTTSTVIRAGQTAQIPTMDWEASSFAILRYDPSWGAWTQVETAKPAFTYEITGKADFDMIRAFGSVCRPVGYEAMFS